MSFTPRNKKKDDMMGSIQEEEEKRGHFTFDEDEEE
jgi:hypothetical protein